MIRQFDVTSIPLNSFVIISSPRKTGKTVLASHLVKQFDNKVATCIIISKTSTLQNSFAFCKTHVDPQTDDQFEQTLEGIIQFQMIRKAADKPLGNILIVMDDLFVSSTSGVGRYSLALSSLAARGRHLQITCILITQRWQSISPSIRSQCNYYLSFRPRSSAERKMIINEFLSRENTISRSATNKLAKDALSKVFEGDGKDYRAIVINSDSRETNISDYVFYVKAPKIENWTMRFKPVVDQTVRKKTFLSYLE